MYKKIVCPYCKKTTSYSKKDIFSVGVREGINDVTKYIICNKCSTMVKIENG
jgi:uncharacterized protein YbaR (Trm112 family)